MRRLGIAIATTAVAAIVINCSINLAMWILFVVVVIQNGRLLLTRTDSGGSITARAIARAGVGHTDLVDIAER